MKKTLLILGLTFFVFSAFSQSAIPNGNFESWTSVTFDYPTGYPYTSNSETFFRYNLPFNFTKTSDAHHGNWAIQLTTIANLTDTAAAYFVNSQYTDGNNWHGGFPYSETPSGLRGYYKCNVPTGDSSMIIVSFSKSGNNIGMYMYKMGGIKNTYTLFDFDFEPALPMAPDSIIFAAISSDMMNNVYLAGSTLILDSITLTGVNNQPALLNGDFETWQNQTLELPNLWRSESDMGQGLSKTTDAAAGNFAVELTTYLGNHNGSPVARSGRISTGYYPNNCNGNCYQLGGYPFTNQVDTLVLHYKYIPSGTDTGEVRLNFKKNSVSIWSNNYFLMPSLNYQVIEIPFNIPQIPDTVIIDIQSSTWNDTLLSFVGSRLIIDEVHFKSQPLGTNILSNYVKNEDISIFPNPFKTSANLSIGSNIDIDDAHLIIMDITGKEIKSINVTSRKISINKDELESGIYLYELRNKFSSIKTGKFIIE